MATRLTFSGDSMVAILGVDWASGESIVEEYTTKYSRWGWAESTIKAVIKESSGTALQALVESIETLLYDATYGHETVYLIVELDGEADSWRSRILWGELIAAPLHLGEWHNLGIRVTINVRRWMYYEGSEVELELAAVSDATPGLAGVTIHNSTDSTPRGNYVEILADQVAGVIPAPVRLVLTNNSGSDQGYRAFYLAVNALSDPTNFAHVIEGEDCVSGGTPTSESGNSGGEYLDVSVTTSGSLRWTLSTTLMQQTQGRVFRLLMRLRDHSVTPDILVTPQIRDNAGLTIFESGDPVRLPSSGLDLVDLGTLHFPPGGTYDSWQEHGLVLLIEAAGTVNLDVDYIQLLATDSYMQIAQLGSNVVNGATIIIDGTKGIVQSSGRPNYSVRGGPLLLFPNRDQRLYILYNLAATAPVDGSLSVRAYYRPRRLTV